MNRREFFKTTTTSALAFLKIYMGGSIIGTNLLNSQNIKKLRRDPNKIIDLHRSLDYRVISTYGDIMDDGYQVPDLPDGMAAIQNGNHTVLVRNHELHPLHSSKKSAFNKPKSDIKVLGRKHYDPKAFGGTTNLVYDEKSHTVVRQFLSLSGTSTNCAGGVTPWDTWLTCEENVNKKNGKKVPHGYVFEVIPKTKVGIQKPKPIKALGRFNHEAVAFDSYSNAYLTEDRKDGLFYKFKPKNKKNLKSGKLMALSILGVGNQDTRNTSESLYSVGETYETEWIPLEDIDPKEDTLRVEGQEKGAAIFYRGEGIIYDQTSVFICCTQGGPLKRGQIWKYTPIDEDNGVIELWYEVRDKRTLNMPDNIAMAPWGDLIVCEDNSDVDRLWGMTPSGKPYLIAENSHSGAEIAGACFSPTGNTLFLNLQQNGQTLAVTGNWNSIRG